MNLIKIHHKSQYVTFRLADNLIGINILDIREIVPYIKITQVQQTPAFVLGLINLRGQILTVLDIGVLLGLEKREAHSKSHIIIFKHKNVGFIVDQIGDVIGTDQKHMESIPANIDANIQKYMENIINLPDEILMILNAKKVLSYMQTKDEKTPKEYL
ncbi:MAG: chemotaxis protein CheW [Proteobacteria bacterium]|nr:chemotaxis protein CheW [Pseudomonadota bacterium]MBU1581329.1 chemotaxis protein CheW [Pseudomonadota bacterium]MBU2455814.1 chemotaxis protein CheW [Pseudomonadota bacterium]MBU2631269.1 chemotaxis protein CheW [Pseudomonadota bacterium]